MALAVYWSFLVYTAVVGFGSVIPQTFWPIASAEASAPEGTCSEGLSALRQELRAEAAAQVGGEGGDMGEFFARWDDRHLLLEERCEDEPAYRRLDVLRHRVETSLRRFQSDEGRIFDELERPHETP
ncbi:MAG: hypothetical protein AAGE52_37505 [Myxococcota bacterium]